MYVLKIQNISDIAHYSARGNNVGAGIYKVASLRSYALGKTTILPISVDSDIFFSLEVRNRRQDRAREDLHAY